MKADYSHIESRVFDSYSKSRSISPYQKDLYKSARASIEKVEKLGQQQYEQAMRHVKKFNKYQQEKVKPKQPKDVEQFTFKPKLIKSKYSDAKLRLYEKQIKSTAKLTKTEENPEKLSTTKSNVNLKISQIPSKGNKTSYKTMKTTNAWAKNRDAKIINKTIQNQMTKVRSPSAKSSLSGSIGKNSSYKNLQSKGYKKTNLKLNLDIGSDEGSVKKSAKKIISHQIQSHKVTPRTDLIEDFTKQNSTNTHFSGSYSAAQSPRRDSFAVEHNKKPGYKYANNTSNILSSINSEKGSQKCYGEKLLANQIQRGEGNFYLRQARANIKKNYQKTEVLIKDKTYTKKFSYLH